MIIFYAITKVFVATEYICAAINYGGTFTFAFEFYKSDVFEDECDVKDFVAAFRNSFKELEKRAEANLQNLGTETAFNK